MENVLGPKELANVKATRQRRERAGHLRLMLSTTVINNIDSTLAVFVDEIEKKQAAAFNAYIQLAIANSAASDSTPSPPRIPTHTRPSMSSGSSTGYNKNVMKKVTIATHRNLVDTALNSANAQEALNLPTIPKVGEKNWAIVARNDLKKARISLNTRQQGTSAIKLIQLQPIKDKLTKTA
ncbi:putative eka-like protein [Erysiphe necator]|uniref:Putative eka-like protein n=1 Tax=Uncinula necator TaxID=52586 RepID=A0A0B1PDB0_UNCNE|nr:putative eka-like protein [Erysiphe necator]